MKRLSLIYAVVVFLFFVVGPLPTKAQEFQAVYRPQGTCDPDGAQTSGAIYRICMPDGIPWNNELVVLAHGYVSPTEPIGIPEDQLSLAGTSLPDVVTSLGYAFATTSYSTNGLAVKQGLADLIDLVDIFASTKGTPTKIYLVGASEGGLITALAVEQYQDRFDGGLALCGPYGDFADQINYFGDFRTAFDYFLPGLLPGEAIDIPDSLLAGWDTHYQNTVNPAIENPSNDSLVNQLLSVTMAPYDSSNATTKTNTIAGLLWYNVFSTNDGIAKLGGQPFDNENRVYSGSDDDTSLNADIKRFGADQAALDEIEAYYQTTGQLSVPLITMHTTGDHIIPDWHTEKYRSKVIAADNLALHEHFEIDRYGHCTFTSLEVLIAFNRLVTLVNNPPVYQPTQKLFLPFTQRN